MNTSGSSAAVAMAAPKSVVERIIGIFTNPRATMEDIAARPTWVVPLIIVVIASTAAGFLLKDVIVQNTLSQMQEKNPNIPAEQLATTETWTRIMSWVGALVFTPIFYVVLAAVFLFVGNTVLGGEAKFKTVFSMICWSGIISLLSSIVNIPVMLSRGAMESATSLASLLSPDDSKSVFYFFLSQIDLFTIWWLVVIGFGMAAVYRFSTNKGMTAAFGLWAIYLVIAIGFKALFS